MRPLRGLILVVLLTVSGTGTTIADGSTAGMLTAGTPTAGRPTAGATVFAAASLTRVLDAAVAAGHIRCRCVYAASSVLARQIDAGAEAHVYISANTRWLDYLVRRGAVDGHSRRVIAGNRLVLAAPAGAPFTLSLTPGAALAGALGGGWLAMADPDHVPAGLYGKAALSALGLWPQVASRIAATANVRAAVALVKRGEVAAGIVYASDLQDDPDMVMVGQFPASSHPPITYVAALASASAPPAARKFLNALLSPPVQNLFRAHGFIPAGVN